MSSLKNVRVGIGIKQRDFADLLEVPISSYSMAESGRRELTAEAMQNFIRVTEPVTYALEDILSSDELANKSLQAERSLKEFNADLVRQEQQLINATKELESLNSARKRAEAMIVLIDREQKKPGEQTELQVKKWTHLRYEFSTSLFDHILPRQRQLATNIAIIQFSIQTIQSAIAELTGNGMGA